MEVSRMLKESTELRSK